MTTTKSRRSREGAWIEIHGIIYTESEVSVAPVRERGLKYKVTPYFLKQQGVAPVRERGLKYFPLRIIFL